MNASVGKLSQRAAPRLDKFGSKGPLTRARQRRAMFVYGLLCAVGLAPIWLELAPAWQVAGLGLWMPGGGFIALGGWLSLLVLPTLVLFGLSLIAWFGAGAVTFPVLVWGLSAALAAGLAEGPIFPLAVLLVPLLVVGTLLYGYRRASNKKALDLLRRDRRIAFLPAARVAVEARASAVADSDARELSLEDLQGVRYLLDRSLQPIEAFEGFDRIDQFQTSSLRYQLNGIGYALALMQCHYTPSFHGYLSLAQRNVFSKYLQKDVWGYWIYETAWGHLNLTNFDPADKDNIMLTGWFSLQLGMYMGNTGDKSYTVPGSLTFQLNKRTAYRHDHHSLNRSVVDNFEASPFCLYPCEPGWTYPICNHYGFTSMVLYDRLYGTQHAERLIEPFLDQLDTEFTDAKGTPIGLRSTLIGIELPFPSSELLFASFTNAFAPERAWQMWALARTELGALLQKDANGEDILRLPATGIDFGNYRRGNVGSYGHVIATAREFGDDAFAEAALRGLREAGLPEVRDGVRRYAKGSNMANIGVIQACFRRRDDYRKLVIEGPVKSTLSGPILAHASYPQVLVAKAFSGGADLQLVLYPGAVPGPQRIGIARLKPHAEYCVTGAVQSQIRASGEGGVEIDVHLDGRTAVELSPL